MKNLKEKILFSREDISQRVQELIGQIADDFAGTEMAVIGILKGSFIFLADLTREMHNYDMNPQIDFTILSSYGASTSPTTMVKIERDISIDLRGKAVLVIDDILDTGRTMHYLRERLKWLEPEFVKVCVFLDKPSRRICDVSADYVGFSVDDVFVVGYGLDYDGYHREKPYIAVLEEQ